ncbi:MAG: FHA domain-containing protein, partial [Janthinobacterium lividum]
ADPSWSDLVETLWDEVVAAESIADVAARLAWYRIDSMPSFAAFFWGADGMRSLVRGAVKVVDADSGDVVATGEGVQTWVETGLGDLRQVRVELPAERPDGVFPLPLVVGAVGVSAVFLDATDESVLSSPQQADPVAPETSEEPTPEPTVQPEQVPEPPEPPEPMALEVAEPTSRTEHELADTRMVSMPELLAEPDPALEAAGGEVQAVFCAWGHPNPPGAGRCRVCEGLIAVQPPRSIPVPAVAVLRASSGATVEVVTSVVVGRAPTADRARVDDPALLTVTSPSHDISRSHLEVFASGWDVGVTDLHSTNGTVLVTPDGSIRTMDPGETVGVELGTSLELADGISVLIDYPQ